MERRREYVAPAVAWEDVLEQTSLACNATMPAPLPPAPQCFAGDGQTWSAGCLVDATKGGSFVELDPFCRVHFEWPDDVVVLS